MGVLARPGPARSRRTSSIGEGIQTASVTPTIAPKNPELCHMIILGRHKASMRRALDG